MIDFWKVHGNGNDFVVLDDRRGALGPDLPGLTRRICDRRTGLGADGTLVVSADPAEPFRMRIFNADGSEGEMCGNGARCFARWLFERGLSGAEVRFSTLAGLVSARVDPPFVTLDLPPIAWGDRTEETLVPRLDPALRAAAEGAGIDPEALPGESVRMTSLVVGVSHTVLTGPDWRLLPRPTLVALGRALRRDSSRFPEGVNVNFSVPEVTSGCGFAVTYERGVEDLTDSCGTGCTASALVAAAPLGLPRVSMVVRNPGGENRVELSFRGERVEARLIGRTAMVAEGRFYREESEGRVR